MFSKKFLAIALLLFFFNNLIAQESPSLDRSKFRYGFIYGWADQAPFKEKDYSWEINTFKFQINYPIKKGRKFYYEALLEPQINSAKYRLFDRSLNRPADAPRAVVDENHVLEYGLTLGAIARYPLGRNLSAYGLLSFGTFYLGSDNKRIAQGIAFATQGSLGLRIRMFGETYFDVRAGMRHLSNAGLQKPNSGVNTFHLESGFLIDF
ncbi:MAG: acyloxyacyl hydrolase [Flavobacteriaceae bacterium]|nr:acyloxyacyl hydrolase [Flavobacteriaceae bacterium]